MPAVLRLRTNSKLSLELDGLHPGSIHGKSSRDIAKMVVWAGKEQVSIGDFFTVEGSALDEVVRIIGDLTHCHRLGAGMQSGHLIVEGSVGMHAGAEMAGGELTIQGNAGAWLGAQMTAGRIHCQGNAGDGVGAAYPGRGRGMAGGIIRVDGNVGAMLGRRMRRGMIVVGGNAGDGAGSELLAGTIIVRGSCNGMVGNSMRRGTIIVLGPSPMSTLSFRNSGIHRPVFVRMIASQLKRMGVSWADQLLARGFRCRHGDMLELGRGEILAPLTG